MGPLRFHKAGGHRLLRLTGKWAVITELVRELQDKLL